jgi:uncharacterized protein with NRDE domain
MCLLALFFRVVEDAAVVVGANREELYERGGEPPRIQHIVARSGDLATSCGDRGTSCRAIAGIDPVAGGTWFGVNEHGVVVSVTNRPKSEVPVRPKSRGLLVRELLGFRTAAEARDEAVRQISGNHFAGCNLLCADAESALVIHAGDWLRVRPLPPGIHCLTSHDVDDAGDRRLAYALGYLNQRSYENAGQCVLALKALCPQAGNGTPPICLHGERGGTVSSTILVLRAPLWESRYWHAQGPPDVTPYADYAHLIRELRT